MAYQKVQSILFDKKKFSEKEAVKWLIEHNREHYKVHETDHSWRFRQFDPILGAKYKTIHHPEGVTFIVSY